MAVSEKELQQAAAAPSAERLWVAAAPRAAAVRRWRPRHVAAGVAALAYGGSLYAAFVLASPHLEGAREASAVGRVAGGATAPALSAPSADLLAMRALAARAQRGVYVVEGAGGGHGSGFVAWVQAGQQRSFVMTARAVVAGVLADGGRSVYVKRGDRFWEGRIVRADKQSGLALIRVDTVFQHPLWQQRSRQGTLGADEPAFLVPAGPDAPFGEGTPTAVASGAFALETGSAALNRGAPVVASDGRVAGVVVATGSPHGSNRIVPIGRACGKIRRCA